MQELMSDQDRIYARLKRERRLQDERARDNQKAADNQKDRKGRDDALDNDLENYLVSSILASSQSIAAFEVKLDRYDTAVVEALLENEEALLAINSKINAMLDQAYILPDGRRVFKTENGLQVFDEFGVELDGEVFPPESVPDHLPRWERFVELRGQVDELNQERQELLNYQNRLDEARDTLDDDALTEQDCLDLGDELDAAMPDAVREKLGLEVKAPEPARHIFNENAAPAMPVRQPILQPVPEL
jgi:hypothetical protein